MKAIIILAAVSLSGCATGFHERANPAGGPPLTTFASSSDAEEVTFTAASGATLRVRKLDNSSGPREAVKIWGMIGLGRKAVEIAGDLGAGAIEAADDGR